MIETRRLKNIIIFVQSIRIVIAFFQVGGMTFFLQISAIMAVKYELRYEQRL